MHQTKYLHNGSRVLIPAGTHGGSMEWLLQQALVWTDKEGKKHRGIDTSEQFEEIGGPFDSSESYRVKITTDSNGDIKVPLHVEFTNPTRPKGEMYLDAATVERLSNSFRELHKDDNKQGLKNLRMYKK